MHISKVSIRNYRNFANSFFTFQKGINTILGENGAGKSNVFRAIRLLLEDSYYQFAYKLSDTDFNRSISDWRGRWIIISIEFDEISQDEAIQSLFIHGTGIIDAKDFVKKATYNLFFRPKADIRAKLAELKEGDKEGLEEILKSITIRDNYETFFTGKSTADFNDETTYKELVGDFENVKFSPTIDSGKFGLKIPHQLSVAKEVSFTFIQALRDVVSDFNNNKTNPLITLLKNKSGEIEEADYAPISKMVTDLNTSIENLPDVQKIREDIKETIKDAVGQTYSPSSLSIKSSLSAEANKLLQSLKLFIGEPGETHEGGIHELSLGGANLIFLTLKLLEYKYNKSKNTFANFLIIEEPEAHIHTHIQKTLFDKLEFGDTQIIYSTHSNHISEVSNVCNINILAKEQDNAIVFQPATGLAKPNIGEVQRYLDAVRTNLLFAKGVLLVEGDAEEILIPRMIKKAWGVSLDELGISLINIRSTGFENVSQLFHDTRIRRRCAIITDLDAAITDTTAVATDTVDVAKYKIKVAGSAAAGKKRETELNLLASTNRWISPFYADHTFEVDLIKSGNAALISGVVDSVYTDVPTRIASKAEIASADVAVYGKRVLTMAKHVGKGWFAILLGASVTYKTIIPGYIVKAVLFGKTSLPERLVVDIVNHRIQKHQADNNVLDFTPVKQALAEYLSGKVKLPIVAAQMHSVVPNDQVLALLNLL